MHANATRGFSLLVVLVTLAMICLLLVALFSGATHGLRFSANDANLARETMLADSAAALVIGQLEQATTQPGQAWISQPGLIRTFAASSSARAPSACYKLYSAPQMVDTSGGVSFLAGDVPPDWNSSANAGVYIDINAPVSSLSGDAIYPVLDARAVTQVAGLSADAGHEVEMPVAWLYELRDGSLGPASAATTSNPIVGRVAFWTDDETSKIDINTAGVASPWDVPRTSSTDDVTFATTQPASGEFERYPGHPGGVALDLLFGTGTTANLNNDALLALTPRYNTGGSEFGAQNTDATTVVTAKADRLYNSVDELGFAAGAGLNGQRAAGPLTPDQINLNRFVLTAHSHAPETTLLGDPRIAIWPVSDASTDPTHTTPTDLAIRRDATLGTGAQAATYFLQRHDATKTNELEEAVMPDNAKLFANLVAAGTEQFPGNASTFAQKYPGSQWAQIVVELLDAIRGFNAVDPAAGSLATPGSFVPFAAGDATGVGRGLVEPLTTTSSSGAAVRGLGRFPSLWGLTLVFYVSGFVFSDGTQIDYEATPDDPTGSSWNANFQPVKSPGSRWAQVKKELIRAFVVPTTFQPSCGFPEVSDGCTIRITGLDGLNALSLANGSVVGNFEFPAVCTSALLSDALKVTPAERSWGGLEGPLAWRAAAATGAAPYVFAGAQAVVYPSNGGQDTKTGGPSMASAWMPGFETSPVNLTVELVDRNGATVQTCAVNFPKIPFGHLPTCNGEANVREAGGGVAPSYYMTLLHRVQNIGVDRPLMIQAGDATYGVELQSDPRVAAAMENVPATFFSAVPSIPTNLLGGSQAHDLRFADGTSACFGSTQNPTLVGVSYGTNGGSIPVTDWRDGSSVTYAYNTTPIPLTPTGSATVVMRTEANTASPARGDWDTGIGFSPDGALSNLPDAGTSLDPATAYESLTGGQFGAATRRAPNALIPSPVVFGSLPAGINPDDPTKSTWWRTLLFCPYPISDQNHPGLASPPDYLLLDRFWMPTVEPYGISTRFETTGKINLNDQIAPFSYLHRSTALRALLHGIRIPAIPKAFSTSFKSLPPPGGLKVWQPVDEDATVEQIEKRFAGGDAYMTESEICSVPLIPQNLGAATPESFWTASGGGGYLTGDNLRELPYAQIYNRLTTRSNSYTVHVRAQVLQKINDHSNPAVWREGTDRVLGEWRGSYEIERYLDPAVAPPAAGQPLGPTAYKYRIVSAQRFAP